MDAWEFIEPVDILSKLPETFRENIESKKWGERKEALEAMLTLVTENSRLDPTVDYRETIRTLKNILLKDSNINVQSLAAKCLTLIAKGLRRNFAAFSNEIAGAIFERFKEKKKVLLDELVACIDAVYESSNYEDLAETTLAALAKPNPQIKSQTLLFLYRAFFKFSSETAPTKHIKTIVPVLVKLLSDGDPEVRESSSAVLGAILKLVHEKIMITMVGDIASDKLKWDKINEYKEKAVKDYENWLSTLPKQASLPHESNNADAGTDGAPTVVADIPKEADPWDFMDPVDITKDLSKTFFEDIQSKKWQEKKETLEALLSLLTANPRLLTTANYSDIIAVLKDILKNESNINVSAVAVKCITQFAMGLRTAFQPNANQLAPIIFEKFKEKKPVLKLPLIECIDAVYSTTHLDALNEHIVTALGNKNPMIKVQTCQFLYRVLRNFTFMTVPRKQIKGLAPVLVKLTFDPDPEVREATFQALGAMIKAVDKPASGPLLGEVAQDKMKMAKIDEFYEKATSEANPNAVTALQLEQAKKEQDSMGCAKPAQNGVAKPFSNSQPGNKPVLSKKSPPNANGVDVEEPTVAVKPKIQRRRTSVYKPMQKVNLNSTVLISRPVPTPQRPPTPTAVERAKSQTTIASKPRVSSGYGRPSNQNLNSAVLISRPVPTPQRHPTPIPVERTKSQTTIASKARVSTGYGRPTYQNLPRPMTTANQRNPIDDTTPKIPSAPVVSSPALKVISANRVASLDNIDTFDHQPDEQKLILRAVLPTPLQSAGSKLPVLNRKKN